MKEVTLIANSGLQFCKIDHVYLNPDEELELPNGKTLKYTFVCTSEFDFDSDDSKENVRVDICTPNEDYFIPINNIIESDSPEDPFYEKDGTKPVLNDFGLLSLNKEKSVWEVENFAKDAEELISINSLTKYTLRKKILNEDGEMENVAKPAFEILLGKWLPMPLYEFDEGSKQSKKTPIGWCRVRIDDVDALEYQQERDNKITSALNMDKVLKELNKDPLSNKDAIQKRTKEVLRSALKGVKPKNGPHEYRLVWAFDTSLAENESEAKIRPYFDPDLSIESKKYSLCNRVDLVLGKDGFIDELPNDENDSPIANYIAGLLGVDLTSEDPRKYTFICYYVYLINYLRLSELAPEVVLYNNPDNQIPVDMSVDIGNSRTCSLLFENGDFTKAEMLHIRNLSEPWNDPDDAFDMRVVFRRADFGNDLNFGDKFKNLFVWPSLVRVGDEAKTLIYRSMQLSEERPKATNCSSPKRYLWDEKEYKDTWEFLVVEDDSTTQKNSPQIELPPLTDYFSSDGSYLDGLDTYSLSSLGDTCKYSRSSLMTFVMIEMFQQAVCRINSHEFRKHHGDINCRRYLRNIIVTCPTAMPIKEQVNLRNAAGNAAKLLVKFYPWIPEPENDRDTDGIRITPSEKQIKAQDQSRGWLYDEAFANQFVYLYAELAERYDGKIDSFMLSKGHYRKQMEEYTFEELGVEGGKKVNSLTIGSIDIGAGTTDVLIASYGKKERNGGMITPIPLYYDSFYSAGDDIVQKIISEVILEDRNSDGMATEYNEKYGSIGSALKARIFKMTPDELRDIPCVKDSRTYRDSINSIENAIGYNDSKNELRLRNHFANDLMHDFFGSDAAAQSEKDRRCRVDFCTQISIPITNKFLDLLCNHRPDSDYSFDELFPKDKPAQYLLNHFEYHFGFRFEELIWRYNSDIVAEKVHGAMESLIKMLSAVINAYHCDILVLSGRPTRLEPVQKLMHKYFPVMPNPIVKLSNYRPGRWYPLGTGEGYIQENQKAIVAVGAEVGHLASHGGFNSLVLDFSALYKNMKSTANYMGEFDESISEIKDPFILPTKNSYTLRGVTANPYYIGCKNYNAPKYQARPLYAIYNNSSSTPLKITLMRNDYKNDCETLVIDEVTDMDGNNVPKSEVELTLQTLTHNGNFWMDKGAFELDIQNKQ